MKRSGTKTKYSPMEQANVYKVQFMTMSEDLLVSFLLNSAKLVRRLDYRFQTL